MRKVQGSTPGRETEISLHLCRDHLQILLISTTVIMFSSYSTTSCHDEDLDYAARF